MFNFCNDHSYSVAVVGLPRRYNRVFLTRDAANDYMYKVCRKLGLAITEVWNDNHDKTYHCNHGVTFYIQRA